MTVADSVASALEGRSRLLVFDNCEHVLDAAADLIDRILARSPTAKVLATSREGLRVSDEQLWPVASLDGSSTAATLFVERALSVAPRAALTAGDTAVIEICRHLDGIPLAIELAASRMQSMTVSEIWDRLDDRFRLLVGSRRGLERHQTLRHAVQWSFDLLGDAESGLEPQQAPAERLRPSRGEPAPRRAPVRRWRADRAPGWRPVRVRVQGGPLPPEGAASRAAGAKLASVASCATTSYLVASHPKRTPVDVDDQRCEWGGSSRLDPPRGLFQAVCTTP